MLGAMRKVVGILALLAILALPSVARARFFCRYTGVEITDCEEQRSPDMPVLQPEGCCDRRVERPLAAARVEANRAEVAPVMLVAEPFAAVAPLPDAPATAAVPMPAAASGPPLYVVQRALLI
jgi:hypothetical protein